MSILPEEIPVAFTTFMALGAWRLDEAGHLVKHAKTVETTGSATVICTDKTGTITENRMELAALHVWGEETSREACALEYGSAARELVEPRCGRASPCLSTPWKRRCTRPMATPARRMNGPPSAWCMSIP
ncbi:MAG: hypothetical protein IPN38_05295 [Flavobacteriales bacterium]|nr:hypothetical protein [Flavobacteriales bacterium]